MDPHIFSKDNFESLPRDMRMSALRRCMLYLYHLFEEMQGARAVTSPTEVSEPSQPAVQRQTQRLEATNFQHMTVDEQINCLRNHVLNLYEMYSELPAVEERRVNALRTPSQPDVSPTSPFELESPTAKRRRMDAWMQTLHDENQKDGKDNNEVTATQTEDR